jgi:hypothetical protein
VSDFDAAFAAFVEARQEQAIADGAGLLAGAPDPARRLAGAMERKAQLLGPGGHGKLVSGPAARPEAEADPELEAEP